MINKDYFDALLRIATGKFDRKMSYYDDTWRTRC
jgi:hypothetical protein